MIRLKSIQGGLLCLVAVVAYFMIAVGLLPPVSYFEQGSDGLIVDSLRIAAPQEQPNPFMLRQDPRISEDFKPYYSQFGLTYRTLLPMRDVLPLSMLHLLLSLAYAIASALIFWWAHKLISRENGNSSGVLFLILCCATPAFVFFSGSFYWQLPLLVAPFLITYAFVRSHPFRTLCLVYTILTLRFLGGYEYTSSLILSPLAAVALRWAFDGWSAARGIRMGIALGFIGFMAFATAMSLHLLSMSIVEGGFGKAVESFSDVMKYRTNGDYFGRKITLRDDAIQLINSFFRNETILVGGLALIALFVLLRREGVRVATHVGLALGFCFASSLSWQILARGHMRDHSHINFIVYFIPFGLAVYIAFSRTLGELLDSSLRIRGSIATDAPAPAPNS